ncbi:FecR family protein [Chitinophaga vietnamensis]|uniref:FecR family protein n=1 Tax=Chitinophaga vietnamensis TaxID=2593957 RepID=UPI001177D6BF|nr:FecR family protein [Chitinophaga vietnamensis]
MEAKAYYKFLLERYYNGTASAAETEELYAALIAHPEDEDWQELIAGLHAAEPADPNYDPQRYEQHIRRILLARPRRISFFRRYAAAAAVLLLLLAAVGYFLLSTTIKKITPVATTADVKPGHNGAILTLADGSELVLDSLQNGVVTTQQGTRVVMHNGQLRYEAGSNSAVSSNTMSTPRGRKFRLQLPDGTVVWLNAASAITFPTAFTGHERRVQLKGEAYFEVAQNKEQPFRVQLHDEIAVEVLGTHFNINAYDDEANISTTLMEGAVRVNARQRPEILKPGQQLLVDRNAGMRLVNHADTSAVLAWKNGVMNFQDKQLTEVMRLLARWYDIEIVYETTPPDITFYGEIGSDVNLSSVLTFLRDSGVPFRIEGRKLIVGAKPA